MSLRELAADPTLALAFALGSSAGWATLDALRKRLGGALTAPVVVTWFSLGQIPFFAVWWWLTGGDAPGADYWGLGLLDLALNVAANLMFVAAVARAPLSITVPFMAFTPVFTTAVATLLLDQRPRPLELAGIVVVVLGGLSLGLSRDASRRRILREPGVWMMLGVAALWSTTIALDTLATRELETAPHALIQTGGVGVVVGLYTLLRGGGRDLGGALRSHGGLVTAAALAAGIAMGLQLLALQGLDAGHVETQKRVIGLAAAVLVGRWLFAEPITPRKVLGVAIMAAGTAMVALGASASS